MRRLLPLFGLVLWLSLGCEGPGPTALEDEPRLAYGGPDAPPVVTVYDINMNEIDALTVNADEAFTLIGTAVGNEPLSYYWFLDEGASRVFVANVPYLVDYFVAEPGDYVIVFEVTDVNGLTGSDQVELTVLPAEPTPEEELSVLLRELEELIAYAPPHAFVRPQRVRALLLKLAVVRALIDEGAYDEARSKLEHDILPKVSGWDRNSWIRDSFLAEILTLVVLQALDILEYLASG